MNEACWSCRWRTRADNNPIGIFIIVTGVGGGLIGASCEHGKQSVLAEAKLNKALCRRWNEQEHQPEHDWLCDDLPDYKECDECHGTGKTYVENP